MAGPLAIAVYLRVAANEFVVRPAPLLVDMEENLWLLNVSFMGELLVRLIETALSASCFFTKVSMP
jgi:hypothetical protein